MRSKWRSERITQAMRQQVARRIGALPGQRGSTLCTYCANEIIYVDWRDPDRVRFTAVDGRSLPCLDHIYPLSRGGPHTIENLALVCLSCNCSKCDMLLPDVRYE